MNEIYTLFLRDNFMKIYENYFGAVTYSNRFDNGLRVSGDLLYEDRLPINTTDYSFSGQEQGISPNYLTKKSASNFRASGNDKVFTTV